MNMGCAGKTVRSVENVCHTWAPWRCVHNEALHKSTFNLPFTLLAPYPWPFSVSLCLRLWKLQISATYVASERTSQWHRYILKLASRAMCFPGCAEMPVIKSAVTKGRSTTECWQEGKWDNWSRSKWTGISTTGIWLIFCMLPAAAAFSPQFSAHHTTFAF